MSLRLQRHLRLPGSCSRPGRICRSCWISARRRRWRSPLSPAQQLPHRGSPRGHSMLEPEIIDDRKLVRGKHDLQSFAAHVVHDIAPI